VPKFNRKQKKKKLSLRWFEYLNMWIFR
jgi:hypothetical protein